METAGLVALGFVVSGRKVFSMIVGFVEFAWCPVELELFLGNAIFQPMVTHVKGF